MSAERALLVVIIFGVVIVIMALFYNVLFDIGKTEFSKVECQTSLQWAQAVEEWTPGAFCIQAAENPVPLRCSRRFLTVKDDDVLIGGKSIKPEYNPGCGAGGGGQCLAQNVLAEEMARCWNTFFEGEYPVFQQVEEGLVELFADDGRACFVCAEVALKTSGNITKFTSYLENTVYSGDETYYSHIAENKKSICNPSVREQIGYAGNTCWDVVAAGTEGFWNDLLGVSMPPIEQDEFMAGENYAVTFMRLGMKQQENCGDDPDSIPTMSVQVLRANDIGKYCNQVLA